LILFTTDPDLPIDNNVLERHSKRGAQTAAVLFTLLEVNPREYFKNLVQDIHRGKLADSPYQFKSQKTSAN
jgi:hypothetical protein